MNNLPYSDILPVTSLSNCFLHTTTSYKFYWFISIIEHVHTYQGRIISVDDLKSNMIAYSWYPTVYFNLSLGKQDQLNHAVSFLTNVINKETNVQRDAILQEISELRSTSVNFDKEFKHLGRYVPYRFLECFFQNELHGIEDHKKNKLIIGLAEHSFLKLNTPCLYRFLERDEKEIEIHPEWYNYIQQHFVILSEHCIQNLLTYLQLRNPGVTNIAEKLFRSENYRSGK